MFNLGLAPAGPTNLSFMCNDYMLSMNKKRICRALENGKVSSIEFYSDGSGVLFNFWDPTFDHGRPCTMGVSLKIGDALECLRGYRLKQHEHSTCF